jgi:hypothetical protein
MLGNDLFIIQYYMSDQIPEITNRFLTIDDYMIIAEPEPTIGLMDRMICLYNGMDWLLIRLDHMLSYPVIDLNYMSQTSDRIYLNTLVCCPITLRCVIFKGQCRVDGIRNNILYIKHLESGDIQPIDQPFSNIKDQGTHILRRTVKIITLREIYGMINDPHFIKLNQSIIEKSEKNTKLVPIDYLESKKTIDDEIIYQTFHPKTLVHIVQYYSDKKKEYHHTVLVGRDIDKNKVTGYSYVKTGLNNYLIYHNESFEEKKAFLFPMLWYMVNKIYPAVKLVNIP